VGDLIEQDVAPGAQDGRLVAREQVGELSAGDTQQVRLALG
jgi:ABC-type Mn2+/Zn2+ transport system ATPase subunit